MERLLQIGNVIEVRGTRIKIQVEKEMNHSSLIYNGEIINNITVNGFIMVKKGFVDIVGKIDAEYIEDLLNNKNEEAKDHRYNKGSISRILEIQIVGFVKDNLFYGGIRHLPMIGNIAYIPDNKQVNEIYAGNRMKSDSEENTEISSISIGKSIIEEISIQLPINHFFASHIGIFGNTGSGKSNTLAKLYYELFRAIDVEKVKKHSSIHVIDFNGEYAHDGVFGLMENQVGITEIGSNETKYKSKFNISESYIKDGELLSILFSATEQTQKPFIKRLLKRLNYANNQGWTTEDWIPNLYAQSIVNSNKEIFEYLKEVIDYSISEIDYDDKINFLKKVEIIQWHTKVAKYFVESPVAYFDSIESIKTNQSETSGYEELKRICTKLKETPKSWFNKFVLNAKLQLVSDMLNKHAQFDHINPLIHRIESKVQELENTVNIADKDEQDVLVNIYSFRECSTDIKKTLPTLIVKKLLDNHKSNTNQGSIDKTIHLIIDEAHNILSPEFNKEGPNWHDYRIEMFEEIIKEGRKFGFFVTISSQRPSDISSTIISQVHNFFIHRLVNNKDLEMIDNTIPTLDRVSKSSIPSLASGSCIVTGTALSMPILIQVDRIQGDNARPNSDNVNLIELWKK